MGLFMMFLQLIEVGIQLVVLFIMGLIEVILQIVVMILQIIFVIWDGFVGVDWFDFGVQIIKGFIDGFFSMVGVFGDVVGDIVGMIIDFFFYLFVKWGLFFGFGWWLKELGVVMFEQFNVGVKDEVIGFGDVFVEVVLLVLKWVQFMMILVFVMVEEIEVVW